MPNWSITLYGFLMREGKIPTDWFAAQVALADRTDGDIDTLSNRIAQIRTWTFVANRPDWLADPEHWQGIARGVEDRLSDALHERLRSASSTAAPACLMRRLRENAMLETEISKTGDVLVEGHLLGRLEGFRFAADASAGGPEAKALRAAAQKALAGEIDARADAARRRGRRSVRAGVRRHRCAGSARRSASSPPATTCCEPRVRILADEQLTGAPRDSRAGAARSLAQGAYREAARPAAGARDAPRT